MREKKQISLSFASDLEKTSFEDKPFLSVVFEVLYMESLAKTVRGPKKFIYKHIYSTRNKRNKNVELVDIPTDEETEFDARKRISQIIVQSPMTNVKF